MPTEAEPSIAVGKNGESILVTANAIAALSNDRGMHWSVIDPGTKFQPQPAGQEFLCDQVVLYDSDRDLMVWYMQHKMLEGVGNFYRLAVASGDDISNQNFSHYDISPTDINANWTNTMLDFPDIVMTKNSVYISTNIFNYNTGDSYKGAVTVRIPMDDIKQLKPLTYDIFTTAPQDAAGFNNPGQFGNGNLRGTRGLNQATLYLGTQPDSTNSSLLIYAWDESSSSVNQHVVNITPWVGGRRGQYSAIGPDGRDFLQRVDGRITAAWNAGSTIGFAWTAAPDLAGKFKNAHARVALISKKDMSLISEPNIFSDLTAYAYPALRSHRSRRARTLRDVRRQSRPGPDRREPSSERRPGIPACGSSRTGQYDPLLMANGVTRQGADRAIAAGHFRAGLGRL